VSRRISYHSPIGYGDVDADSREGKTGWCERHERECQRWGLSIEREALPLPVDGLADGQLHGLYWDRRSSDGR